MRYQWNTKHWRCKYMFMCTIPEKYCHDGGNQLPGCRIFYRYVVYTHNMILFNLFYNNSIHPKIMRNTSLIIRILSGRFLDLSLFLFVVSVFSFFFHIFTFFLIIFHLSIPQGSHLKQQLVTIIIGHVLL